MIIELSETSNIRGINLMAEPYIYEGLSLALVANKGGGKSHALAVLAEEVYSNQLPFLFFDPNGDAASLRALGDDVIVIGRGDHREPLRRAHFPLGRAVADPGYYVRLALEDGFSLVVDLSGLTIDEQAEAFAAIAGAHFELAGEMREPCLVLVDESHLLAPQSRASAYQKLSLNTFVRLMSDGRKRGVLLALATQRATFISKDVLALANVRIFGKITWYDDYKRIREYLPREASFRRLSNFQAGQCYIVSPNAFGEIRIKGRRTPDLGKTPIISRRKTKQRPSLSDLQMPLPFMARVTGED